MRAKPKSNFWAESDDCDCIEGRLEEDMEGARELASELEMEGIPEVAEANDEERDSRRSLTTLYSSAYARMVSSKDWTSAGRWFSWR